MKKSVITRFASTALAILMLACLCVPASAAGLEFFICGIQAHRHGLSCYDGGLADLLAANGLQDSNETIYVIHQHVDACYGAGGCPLEGSAVMAEYPNVKILHQHDGNCRVCWLEETPYRVAGTEGASEEVPAGDGASVDGGYAPECFVVTVPGGLKNTGENAVGTEGRSMYIMEPHVHGSGCGGSCGKPIVLVYEGDGAGRLICGLEEHIHGEPCLARKVLLAKKLAQETPLVQRMARRTASLDDGACNGGVLPNAGGTGVAPFHTIGMAIVSASLGLLLAGGKRKGKDE